MNLHRLFERLHHDARELLDLMVPLPLPHPGRRATITPFARPLVDFHDRAHGLADRLAWNLKDDPTTVLTRDLGFTRTYRIQAKRDLSWAPLTTRNEVNHRINAALREFHDGWMIHDHLDRRQVRRYPEADFPDPASWLVDQERKLTFESGRHYSSTLYRTFTYLPPAATQAKIDNLLYVYGGSNNPSQISREAARETFEAGIKRLINVLGEDFTLEPLGLAEATDRLGQTYRNDEQLAFYLRLLRGLEQPVRAVDGPEILAELLADRLTRLREGVLRIGDMLLRPLTISEYTFSSTQPNLLDALEQIPGNFTISWRWIGRDPTLAEAEIRRLRGRNLQKRMGTADQLLERPDSLVDPEALRGANDARVAYGEARSRDVAFGYFTMSVVAYEPVGTDLSAAHARLLALTDILCGRLRADGCIVATDQDNELEVLLGSLPAHGHDNVVRGMLSSRNLANFLPQITLWTGEWHAPDVENYGENAAPLAIFSGHGATPYAFNMHVGKSGGHTLLVGETGRGKTSVAGFLVSQHRKYPGSQQIIVDSERQHSIHLRALGGRHIVLAPDAVDGLSPFAGGDPNEYPVKEKIAAMMVAEGGLDPRDYAEEIYTALVYIANGRREDQCVSGLMSAPGISPKLRRALKTFSREGIGGTLFDNPPKARPNVGVTVFETAELKNNRAMHTLALTVLDLEIERMCLQRRPTLIATEEFWELLRHPIAAELFLRGLKTKRRKGANYLLITQSLADIEDSDIARAVIGSCVTKLLLPNENAIGDAAGAYEKLGLAPWERKALADHSGQHALYVVQPSGRRMVSTTMGPVAQATFMQTSEKAIERAERFFETLGPDGYPDLVAAQFEPERAPERARIAESWRRHAYYYPRRNEDPTLPLAAPPHAQPHPSDPFGAHIVDGWPADPDDDAVPAA